MNDTFFEQLTGVCHKLLLHDKNLMRYLKNDRGMKSKTIEDYKLGSFPKDLRDLYSKYRLDPVELREKNIIYNADRSPFKMYPVVIPIKDIKGKSIAIGCRTLLSDDERREIGIPKYRNSNYKKTAYLFGLDRAVNSIRSNNKVFVVEGYFDVITAHQKDIKNVVATCGTLFSDRQLMTLSRYTENICLLFDNDKAGKISAEKIMKKMFKLESGVKVTCTFTPDGFKDLDEYLRSGEDFSFFK